MSEKWKKTKFKKGAIYQEPGRSTFLAQVSIKGKVHRGRFKDKDRAKDFITNHIEADKLGKPPLTERELEEALQVRDVVEGRNGWDICREAMEQQARLPEGVEIGDVVSYYRLFNKVTERITVGEALDRFLHRKSRSNLRPATLADYTSRLNPLRDELNEAQVDFVSLRDLEEIIDDHDWKPKTKNNYRNRWFTFFEWCKKHELANENPAANIDILPLDQVRVIPYTPEECAKYLRAAEKLAPHWIGFLALGFFAGIRSAELERLTWDRIYEDTIDLWPQETKNRRQRIITISENLKIWLRKYRSTGPVVKGQPWEYEVRLKPKIAELAGVRKPTRNIARKSFASYHFALHRSSGTTALEMGTSESLVLSTYRGLVSEKDGERYFGILPESLVRESGE